jgi:hypothetical protein
VMKLLRLLDEPNPLNDAIAITKDASRDQE